MGTEPQPNELLAHYQQRSGEKTRFRANEVRLKRLHPLLSIVNTEAADAERRDLLARLDACQVPQAQLYRLQTECRRRGEEVRELQKALR